MKKLLLVLLLLIPVTVFAQSGGQGGFPAYRLRRLSVEPATCTTGDVYYNLVTNKSRQCLTTNTWSDIGSGSGSGTVTNVTGTAPISVATGTTTPVVSLSDTAVTPGAYTAANITVDQKGRITAAASGSAGVTGSGSVNAILKVTNATGPVVGNSSLSDNGTTIATVEPITITTASAINLGVKVTSADLNSGYITLVSGAGDRPGSLQVYGPSDTRYLYMGFTQNDLGFNLTNGANLSISGGNQIFANDNTNDIGASGATRPRTVYVGTSVVVPAVNATTNYQINGVTVYSGGTPGIAGNATLNTGSKDSAGKVTATGTGASTIVLTFSITFTRAPACFVTNETTSNLVRPVSTTTTLTFNATIVNGDSLSYQCTGY